MKRVMKYSKVLLVLLLSATFFTGCQSNPEDKVRKTVQSYFDAVKMGDVDKALSYATPDVQAQIESVKEFSGLFSEKLFDINSNKLMTALIGYADVEAYQNYEFKATTVEFTDEKHAVVTVEVYIDGNLDQETEIYTVEYDGDWYIEE